MIENKEALEHFSNDMKWLMEHWERGTESSSNSDKSNSTAISRIERYLRSCVNPTKEDTMWKGSIYSRVPIEKIIEYLRGKYV